MDWMLSASLKKFIPVSYTHLTIEVSDTMKVEVAAVSGPRFQEVQVPVSIGRNTEGIWAIRAEYTYDQTALELSLIHI